MSQKMKFAQTVDVPQGHKLECHVDGTPYTSTVRKGDKARLYWEWLAPDVKRPIAKHKLFKLAAGYKAEAEAKRAPKTEAKTEAKTAPAPVPTREVKGIGLAGQHIGDMAVGSTRKLSRGAIRLVNQAMHGRGGSFTLIESGTDENGRVTRLYVRRETAKVQDGASFLVCTQGRYVIRKA